MNSDRIMVAFGIIAIGLVSVMLVWSVVGHVEQEVPAKQKTIDYEQLYKQLTEKRMQLQKYHMVKYVSPNTPSQFAGKTIEINRDGNNYSTRVYGDFNLDIILLDKNFYTCYPEMCFTMKDMDFAKVMNALKQVENIQLELGLKRAQVEYLGESQFGSRKCYKYKFETMVGFNKINGVVCLDEDTGIMLYSRIGSNGSYTEETVKELDFNPKVTLNNRKIVVLKEGSTSGFDQLAPIQHEIDENVVYMKFGFEPSNVIIKGGSCELNGKEVYCNIPAMEVWSDYNIPVQVNYGDKEETGYIDGIVFPRVNYDQNA